MARRKSPGYPTLTRGQLAVVENISAQGIRKRIRTVDGKPFYCDPADDPPGVMFAARMIDDVWDIDNPYRDQW